MSRKSYAVAKCGCCFNHQTECSLHQQPCVLETCLSKKKRRTLRKDLSLYLSSFPSFSELALYPSKAVIENPTSKVLEFARKYIDIHIVLGPCLTSKTPLFVSNINDLEIATYIRDNINTRVRSDVLVPDCSDINTFIEHVGNLGFAWINCSIAQAYKHVNFIHTPYPSVYKYIRESDYRKVISGNTKPEGIFKSKNCK